MPYGIVFEVLKLANRTPAAVTAVVFRDDVALEMQTVNAVKIFEVVLEFIVDACELRSVSVLHLSDLQNFIYL
jgi:hypothetical protein